RLHLDRETRDVAAGSGDVPAGPDDPRQVGLVVQEPGVDRRTAVAQRQDTGRPLVERLLPGGVAVLQGAAARTDADVAVRVDETGQQPAAPADRLRTRHRLERESAVADPDVAVLTLGQHHAGEVE